MELNIYNNIFYSENYTDVILWEYTGTPASSKNLNNNCYYNYDNLITGTTMTTKDNYNTNPLFVDTINFQICLNSPLYKTGIGNINIGAT